MLRLLHHHHPPLSFWGCPSTQHSNPFHRTQRTSASRPQSNAISPHCHPCPHGPHPNFGMDFAPHPLSVFYLVHGQPWGRGGMPSNGRPPLCSGPLALAIFNKRRMRRMNIRISQRPNQNGLPPLMNPSTPHPPLPCPKRMAPLRAWPLGLGAGVSRWQANPAPLPMSRGSTLEPSSGSNLGWRDRPLAPLGTHVTPWPVSPEAAEGVGFGF